MSAATEVLFWALAAGLGFGTSFVLAAMLFFREPIAAEPDEDPIERQFKEIK